MKRKYFFKILIIFFSLLIAFFLCEVILRFKHAIIPNYDIEMWRYAKELKVRVSDENIGHVHQKKNQVIFRVFK